MSLRETVRVARRGRTVIVVVAVVVVLVAVVRVEVGGEDEEASAD